MNFNFKLVLDWVRRHVFIVVFCAIIIVAPIIGLLIGNSIKDGVIQDLTARKGDIDALSSLESTTVTLNVPGREPISAKAVVNKPLLDAYGEMVETLRLDADTVRTAALKHNSKGRDVLMPGIFPRPIDSKRQTIHEEFYPVLADAYLRLLEEVRAGIPPAATDVKNQLIRRSSAFISSVAGGKRSRAELEPDDLARHDEDLLRARKGIYAETATAISLYASPDSVGMPRPPTNVPPSGLPLERMFEWNWNFWITDDILRALAATNAEAGNVIRAPVKRVVDLRIRPIVRDAGERAGGGAAGGASAAGGAEGAVGGGTPVDAKPEVRLDPATSITGRVSNDLYDVREVKLELVIATDALPKIADALARQNFITITNVALKPADPFEAARAGFIYGVDPVSQVTLMLEVIQLREWTTLRMPDDMKARLGTQGVVTATPGDGEMTAPGT